MVEISDYIPVAGDVVWIDFNPQSGHEQAGRRPAVVLSPWSYNRSGRKLAIFCPVTSKKKNNPFEISIPENLPISGVILADQIRSMDWQSRNAEYLCSIPDDILDEVLDIIVLLLQI